MAASTEIWQRIVGSFKLGRKPVATLTLKNKATIAGIVRNFNDDHGDRTVTLLIGKQTKVVPLNDIEELKGI